MRFLDEVFDPPQSSSGHEEYEMPGARKVEVILVSLAVAVAGIYAVSKVVGRTSPYQTRFAVVEPIHPSPDHREGPSSAIFNE